jgi:hypothetical protein
MQPVHTLRRQYVLHVLLIGIKEGGWVHVLQALWLLLQRHGKIGQLNKLSACGRAANPGNLAVLNIEQPVRLREGGVAWPLKALRRISMPP